MSYTVLARKWRPKNFQELVGQEHVMQALSNALDQQRLHHAYLFTGTRGVGKTTIARIFAKALNCEQGIGSNPCGKCSVCLSVDEGRFVDLIEIDAASRTKVEDTRELLDNVQYAPTQGRFKVYLIDEVHMLSKNSFNALLKTLEEPPAHVKFLLATTDPHKLPITVLSRCLQFNLLRLNPLQIQTHLANLLTYEKIPFEETALGLIAKAADGSVRDSLSLLDQAIAYSGGNIAYTPVQTMLGLVDIKLVEDLLTALNARSKTAVKDLLVKLAQQGADYLALTHQLIEALNLISQVQILGEALDESELGNINELAQGFTPETVQMLYQIALLSQQDMKLAPTMRIGFEMAILRMLAFEPFSSAPALGAPTNVTPKTATPPAASQPTNQPLAKNYNQQEIIAALKKQAMTGKAPKIQQTTPTSAPKVVEKPAQNFTPADEFPELMELLEDELAPVAPEAPTTPTSPTTPTYQSAPSNSAPITLETWIEIIKTSRLEAAALVLANNSILLDNSSSIWQLSVKPEQAHTYRPTVVEELTKAIQRVARGVEGINFVEYSGEFFTPADLYEQQAQNLQAGAVEAIMQDTNIKLMQEVLDMKLLEKTIKPIATN